MTDKVEKQKKQKTKSKKEERGVLAALPATRTERIGNRRSAAVGAPAPKTTTATAASKAAAAPRAPAAPKAAPKARAKLKPKAAARKPAARPKAAAPRTFEPTQAATDAAAAPPLRKPAPTSYPRPRPVSEGAPGIGTTGLRDHAEPDPGRPSGVELATIAVKAAGELAQVSISIGGQLLKRAADRLPKP